MRVYGRRAMGLCPAELGAQLVALILLVVLVVLLGCLVAGRARPRDLRPPGVLGGAAAAEPFPFLHRDLPPPEEMFAALRRPVAGCDFSAVDRKNQKVSSCARGVERVWPADLYAADGLSSHFTEEVRARCRFGRGPSVADAWRDPKARRKVELVAAGLEAKGVPRGAALREGLYAAARWCNFYNPTFCAWLYRELARKMDMEPGQLRILDPSAGWGDRLLAACAVGAATYVGYDPNSELAGPYAEIIRRFAPATAAGHGYRVVSAPFPLEPDAPRASGGFFDLVHTSPPFFDLERYPAEGDAVARRYPAYQDWLREFYAPYLRSAWAALRPGGYFCLYITDIRGAALERDTLAVLAELGGEAEPCFGFRQRLDWPESGQPPDAGAIRPAHVWRKPNPAAPAAPAASAASAASATPAASAASAASDLVIDTLNLTHHLLAAGRLRPAAGSASKNQVTWELIAQAIAAAAPVLHPQYSGRLYFVLKDPDGGRPGGRAAPKDKSPACEHGAAFARLAAELGVHIHVAERARDPAAEWQRLGTSEPTHQKVGRDDFYMGYLAWKRGAPVLSEDRMRDFQLLKTEVRPFRVRAFDRDASGGNVDHIFPGAPEYRRIRKPRLVRYADVGL